jgi:hypothetical protein
MTHRHLPAALFLLCGLASVGPASAGAAEQEVDKSPAFTIVGARVFDGEQWLPAGTQVRVQHGLVLAVGPDVGLARGATIIDASGKALLPEQAEGAQAGNRADKLQSGHGTIVAGAHADLRLVESCPNAGDSRDWSVGEIIARWKSGVLIGRHASGTTL